MALYFLAVALVTIAVVIWRFDRRYFIVPGLLMLLPVLFALAAGFQRLPNVLAFIAFSLLLVGVIAALVEVVRQPQKQRETERRDSPTGQRFKNL